MEGFVTVCASALLLAVSALLLREFGFRGAPVFTVFGALLLILSYFDRLGEPIRTLEASLASCGIEEAAADVLRILGIGALSSVTADTCRDLGEERIASVASSVGKAEILLVAFPYFTEAVAAGLSFFGD